MNIVDQAQVSVDAAVPATLINLELYPIDRAPLVDRQRLVRRCRQQLAENGVCLLPNFLTPAATALMAAQADEVVGESYRCDNTHNVYLEPDDASLPPDHPRRRPQRTNLRSVAYDQIIDGHALRSLYEWAPLTDFLAAATSDVPMFRMGDPLAALTINVMAEGQNHGWHFDESETTITLMLQAPLQGGEFEYVPQLRAGGDEYGAVGEILAGDTRGVRKLEATPGTLVMFEGHEALHRVSAVVGDVTRYVAVLCYKSEPGIRNSAEVQQLFYGRTAP
jgi:hypothetical protein